MVGILTRYEDEARPPDPSLSQDYRLSWAKTALSEAEQFLRYGPRGLHQQQMSLAERTIQLLRRVKKTTLRGAINLSETYCNEILRIDNNRVADLTNFRPFWNFSTYNKTYERQARNHSMLSSSWWSRTSADRDLAKIVRQADRYGSGVGHIYWDRRTKDFRLKSIHPLDAMPVRPISLDTFQGALACILRFEQPLNAVHQQFPRYRSQIKADRDASTAGMSSFQRDSMRDSIGNSAGAVSDAYDSTPTSRIGPMPVVDLYYLYIDDQSTNDSSQPILMGEWDRTPSGDLRSLNHWSYEVAPGKPRYPFKRLIIFCSSCVLYDGPSMYWHGMYPVIKYTPSPDPDDTWWGNAALWPLVPLQESLDKLYQAMDDHVQLFMRPGVSGNRRAMSTPEMQRLDPRQPGQRYLGEGTDSKRVEIPVLDPFIERYADRIVDRMETHGGVKSINQLMSLGQMPEGETIEKLLAAMSAENHFASRNLELFQVEAGQMQVHNFTEFYDEARIFATFGQEGLTPELYDFDPYSLVPAYTNGDFASGRLDPARPDVDLRPRYVRSREFNQQFALNVRPGSLLESASMSRRVMVAMVRKLKDVDRYTFLREMGFDNLGPEPPGSIQDRLRKEMTDDAMAVAMAQAQIAAASQPPTAPGVPGGPPALPGGDGGGGGLPGGPNLPAVDNPTTQPEGRQFSMQKPPHMEGDRLSTS